ncbi:hypothetical protein UPYG_G00043240 [Umbra pygmaea]|uniref:DNA polymerase delta subunit 4 n=1 Tax=Umbra pygmaea TaxID=75934 RepID=A0ABD0XQG3_UMBPY
MTAKRAGLITDSFKVVKKAKRENKRKKEAPSHPKQDAELLPLTAKDIELQELRQFDQNWQYGPCTGISRLERWERASLHGLNPPQEIKEMLRGREADPDYTYCLWSGYPL